MKSKKQITANCRYCRQQMGGTPMRVSKEHVLGDTRLSRLGLDKSMIIQNIISAEDGRIDKLRSIKAGSFTIKGACIACNNKWMSGMETEVDPIIDALLEKKKFIHDLNSDEKHTLAKWALKTATVMCMERRINMQSMPESHFENVFNGTWPEGTVCFVSYARPQQRAGATLSGQYQQHGSMILIQNTLPDLFYAFTAHYKDLCIGVAYVDPRLGYVVLQKDIHYPFFMSSKPFYMASDIWVKRINDNLQIGESSVNTITFSVGLSFEPLTCGKNLAPTYYTDSDLSEGENFSLMAHIIELKHIGRNFGKLTNEELEQSLVDDTVFKGWGIADENSQSQPCYTQITNL